MKRTAVIVDDHAVFRKAARELLEWEGFTVVGEAADGRSAIESIRQLRPDFVLLDVQLPDIDGFKVCNELAEDPSRPVIILTSIRDRSEYGSRLDSNAIRGFIGKGELSGSRIHELLGT